MAQSSFPFLKLPLEIRYEVYEHLLVAAGPIDLSPSIFLLDTAIETSVEGVFGRWSDPLSPPPDLLRFRQHNCISILRTSSQIYSEAAPVFWRRNKFKFSSTNGWDTLLRFLITAGRNRRYIRDLSVIYPGFSWSLSNHVRASRWQFNPRLPMIQSLRSKGDFWTQLCETYAFEESWRIILVDRTLARLQLTLPDEHGRDRVAMYNALAPMLPGESHSLWDSVMRKLKHGTGTFLKKITVEARPSAIWQAIYFEPIVSSSQTTESLAGLKEVAELEILDGNDDKICVTVYSKVNQREIILKKRGVLEVVHSFHPRVNPLKGQ